MDPQERAAFLARLDGDLRAEVEALLAHHESDDGADVDPLLQGAASAAWAELSGPRPPSLADFKVVRRLGAGATGTVYEAEQARPRRRVAIKLLHLPTEEARRRFEREAAMLARLAHPGIARILAQGTEDTPEGPRPYLVMELVDGVPLTEFARGRGRAEVVGLLRQVCAAVAHAHQRGVIHRDLKPGNILVDGDGRTKVLDFGLARQLESTTEQTRAGSVLGTLAYMSPEQAAGDPGAVDTRSDVYTLGVIAYEMLAGRLPLALEGKTTPEALRLIGETEPASLPDGGDLVWIVAKAMAKEPERRYSSAAALEDDLARFAADEPVLARPPTATYQLRKFVRRHRALVGGVAATVLALVGGLIVAVRFAQEAHRQKARVSHAAALAELRLACGALDAGRPRAMSRHLDAVPLAERGWAWRYLAQQRDGSVAAASHGLHARHLVLGDGAGLGAIVTWQGRADVLDARTGVPLDATGLDPNATYGMCCAGGGRAWFSRGAPEGAVLESNDGRRLVVEGRASGRGAMDADPSGAWLAVAVKERTGVNYVIVLLSTTDGAVRWRRSVGEVAPSALAFSGDASALAVAQRDAQLRVCDTVDGSDRFVVRTGVQGALCVALDHDATEMAVGSPDHWIEIRDARTGGLRHRLAGHGAAVRCVAYDPANGRLVSGASDLTARIWDTRSGNCVRILRGHPHSVMALGFEPRGVLRSLSLTDARAWPRTDPDVVRAHVSRANGSRFPFVYGVAFSPDGARVASCGWDCTVRVYDATTRRQLACFPAPAPVRAVAYSGDGKWLAFAHDRIEVRDARTGELRGRYGANGVRDRICFLPGDRRLATAGQWDGEVVDLATGKSRKWEAGASLHGRVACSPDGVLLAHELARGSVALRNAADGAVVARWNSGERGINDLAFSPDGRLLAVAGTDTVVRLWSVPAGEARGVLAGHTGPVYALAFSRDGRWLASGSEDHTIRLWDVSRAEERLVLTGHGRYIFDLAFSPDGATLASASGDNSVRFWSTEPVRARAALAERITRAEAALRSRFADAPVAALAAEAESGNEILRRAAANLVLERGAEEAER